MTTPPAEQPDRGAPRAEIVDTGSRWQRAGRIVIDAPPQAVFEVLADPARHPRFDGSGTVRSSMSGPPRLFLGARFGMGMRIGLPYRVQNTVEEFEEGRLIAWRHVGRHRWRYRLDPLPDGTTAVTETFDGSTAPFPAALQVMNAYSSNQVAILKTLVRLKQLVEGESP